MLKRELCRFSEVWGHPFIQTDRDWYVERALIDFSKGVRFGEGVKYHYFLAFFEILEVSWCQVHDGSGSVSCGHFIMTLY